MFKDKKQVKIVALTVTVLFVLGVAGLALSQTNTGYAATSSSSSVGIVNRQMVFQQMPEVAQAQQTLQTEMEQADKDFKEKTANMSEQEKQGYFNQTNQRLNLRQQELMGPIMDKMTGAIKAAADAKGITVVIDKQNVVYGGQDITDDVIKRITGK